MTELFSNIKFGDKFLTAENKTAVFLRFAENAEHKFAFFYVEDWGTVQVFRESGKEVNGDVAYDIIRKVPSLPSSLDEAFKAGAKGKAAQFQKIEGELVDWYSTSDGKDYCCGVKTIDAFEVPEGFYIRKK